MTPFGHEGFGDVFFDRLWPEWRRLMGEEWSPNINFYEKDGMYYLTAEVPGIKKDDLSVTIDNGYLTISGKRERMREEDDAEYYMKELRSGSFSRSFRLPGEADGEKVDATYEDGILKIVMPRKEESKIQKIKVH